MHDRASGMPAGDDARPRRRIAAWAIVLFLLAVGSLFVTGVVGVGRTSPRFFDYPWTWVAGRCWWSGQSPYDYAGVYRAPLAPLVGRPNAFAYAPQAAPLCMALATMPLAISAWVNTALSVACAGSLAWWTFAVAARPARMIEWARRAPTPLSPTTATLLAALFVVAPTCSHVLAMGQSTLIVAAALVWGWTFAYGRRPLLGGALVALAAMKPQLVLLPVLWLLVDRRFRPLAAFAVVSILLAAYPLYVGGGPVRLGHDWLDSIRQYKTMASNQIGHPHMMGLSNVLFALGLPAPDLTLLACVGLIALARFRARLDPLDVLAALLLLSVSFGVSHDYDLLVIMPAIVAIAFHVRGRPMFVGVALALAALLDFPQRLLVPLNVPVLLHWRSLVVFALCGGLLWLLATSRGEATPAT